MSRRRTIEDITKRNVATIAAMQEAAASSRTFGERLADLAVKWVGSWTFLIIQSVLLVIWMTLNILGWINHWDPYPFVLLNLVLSFQAAFATPIILMSENRQSRLDERRNHLDLQINLLAEQENTEQLRLLQLLCEHAGIRVNTSEMHALEGTANPDSIIRQIIESVECTTPGKGSSV
ncbi:MAG TPA: DUF1003 domain-containing protein [Schlesneria sp.]|jgi:uncharacterized membrane protein